MSTLILRLTRLLCCILLATNAFAQNEPYTMRQLACGLSQPWEIKFAPDGWLWVTEANSYQLSRVDPASGTTELLLDLSAKKDFPNFNQATTWPQGGLQGFAFHPDFANNPYVYIGYVHHFDSCASGTGGCFFKTKIVRYNYNMATKVFSNETVINDTIPGSSDHNGGRLVIGPATASGTNYIFYSVGDMAAGHLGNASRQHRGQRTDVWEGKVLRFNLVADGDAGGDAWIPNDNPFNATGKQNAVWSLGHRNPQGLAFAPDGTLYEAEHGPYSDDEINIIKRANNYGFPLIMGFADGNYDGSKAGAGSGLPLVTSETANKTAIQAGFTYSDPIFSLFPATKAEVTTIFNNDLNNTPPYPNDYLQWPTAAPSGIEYYGATGIPGWKPSLLIANLKLAVVYRLKLSADGQTVVGDTIPYFRGQGRFRDIAISGDGTKIYVAADSVGIIKDVPGVAGVPINKGCILEFNFATTAVGNTTAGNTISLYPNPTKGSFTLNLPAGINEAEVRILNMHGALIQQLHTRGNKTNINTTALPAGVYLVNVTANEQKWSSRLIVH